MRVLGFLVIAVLVAAPPCVFGADEASIALRWNDAHALLPDGGSRARSEVEALFEEAGVDVRWIERAGLGLTVVITPSEPSGPGWHLKPSAMGAHLSGVGSDTVFVFYRRVAANLGLPSRNERLMSLKERRDVSRALARVVVHELLHRLLPSLPHAERGIMRASLDRRALTGRKLLIEGIHRTGLLAELSNDRAAGVP